MWQWLRRHVFRNAGIKTVSLALAITLYLHVLASQEREVIFDVPLVLHGVPETLTGSGEIPEMAKVRFKGLGLGLLKLRTHPQGPRLLLEVGDVRPGRYQRPLVTEDVVVPSDIDVQVVEVVTPREISIEFDRFVKRRLGVVPSVSGRPAPGFITFGRVVVEPESVSVQGPEGRLHSFEFLRTQAVDISDCRDVVIQRVALRVPSRCEAIPREVTVQVTIEKVISRTFAELPVEVLRSGDVKLKRMMPETGSVVVSGPATLVESLTPDELRLSIDALGLPPAAYTLMASVELSRSLEAGAISVEPVEPEKFEVELE